MSLDLDIEKRLGPDFSLAVRVSLSRAALGILGPSGSGKSMTLRCIAGVETPDRGRIVLNGRVLFDAERKINLPPQQRRVGMLFQNYALFPRMSVAANVGAGLDLPAREKAERVGRWLERMRVADLAGRYPRQLSGGQQQRVALARMFAVEPELVLLDEPFSALDSHLREHMQMEMRDIMRERDDVIMVTHSRDEAYRLCDRLAVMDNGRVLGGGDSRELFRNPGSRRVAELTGCKNFSRAERREPKLLFAVDWGLTLETGREIGDNIRHVGIRAHDMRTAEPGETRNAVAVAVTGRTEDPFEWNVVFTNAAAPGAQPLWWKYSKCRNACGGDDVPSRLVLPPEALLLLTDP